MRTRVQVARAFVWIVLLVLAFASWAAEPKFPELTGRVVDQAGILSASTRQRLNSMLAAYEQASGEQVVIVTRMIGMMGGGMMGSGMQRNGMQGQGMMGGRSQGHGTTRGGAGRH